MNLHTLERLVMQLTAMRANLAEPDVGVEMLYEDITQRYLAPYHGLPRFCIRAWDESVTRRLHEMERRGDAARGPIRGFLSAWRTEASTISLRVLFGQMRTAADFQTSATGGQDMIEGFPTDRVIGRPVDVVRGSIQESEIRPDQMPIQIFWSPDHQRWVAINNRGYAAHCLADVQPLRLWPRAPEQAELNRLNETADLAHVTFAPGFTGDRPHGTRVLPSDSILITNLQVLPFEIVQIARVPAGWM